MTLFLFRPVAVLLLTIGAASLFLLDVQTVVRPAFALAFVLLAPGLATTGFLRIRDWYFELLLAITFSIAISIVISVPFVLIGLWSAMRVMLILSVVSLVGALLQLGQQILHRVRQNGDGTSVSGVGS